MTIVDFKISVGKLTDVGRRSFYLALTLLDRTVWLSWWPREVRDIVRTSEPEGLTVVSRPKFTYGVRHGGTRLWQNYQQPEEAL